MPDSDEHPEEPGEMFLNYGDSSFHDDDDEDRFTYRSKEMRKLAKEPWTLDLFLALVQGLMDRHEDIRIAAIESLQEIAATHPEPVAVSPLKLIAYFGSDFTVASGMRPAIHQFLIGHKTPESRRIVKDLLDSPHMRNEDFQFLVNAVVDSKDPELLAFLKALQIHAKQKAKMVRAALGRIAP